ncbi:MAG: FAD-binding oxidoreductase [Chloroflexota bacterium]|nr:FAD-binding oxidoreductase [Chloroflexota bacterium]
MTSLWLSADPEPRRPPLEADASADVVIVGGGIAGVATALAVAERGASVVLLEGRGIAHGASGRNAGFVLAGVTENFAAACLRYGEDRAWRVWEVTRRNRVLLRDAVERHGIACDLRWSGSLQLAGDGTEWEEIRRGADDLRSRGVAVTVDEALRAACYAEDGEVDPVRLVRGLARAAEAVGVRIHEDSDVLSVDAHTARAARGTVRAASVVVCTNAYTSHLLSLRVRPVRGQMLATGPAPRRYFERPTYANRGYRYWRQTLEGRILVGGWRDLAPDVEVGLQEDPTPTIQAALESSLVEQGIDAPVTHRWAGIMGFSHDGLPYVGRQGSGPFVAAGFTGHGMGFALAAAEIVAAAVAGRAHADAELFDPDRA